MGLLQYFTDDMVFPYEEGEPGTCDHVSERIRKLRLLDGDEGDWAINRDTIRILKENGLEMNFMEDLTTYVSMMLAKGLRIVDFQGFLGRDGHFYVADPLRMAPIGSMVNQHLLQGVFKSSNRPQRENKPHRAAFVDGLKVDLGVIVPD